MWCSSDSALSYLYYWAHMFQISVQQPPCFARLGAARNSVLGEDHSGGTEPYDHQQEFDQSICAKFTIQEPLQLTCPESCREDMPSFPLQSGSLIEITKFTCSRNKVAAFEIPERLTCTNYDAKAIVAGSQVEDFRKAVFGRDAGVQDITTPLLKKKAMESVETQSNETENNVDVCMEAEETSDSPDGDCGKNPWEKLEGLFAPSTVSGNACLQSNCASLCEKKPISSVVLSLVPSPCPQGEFSAHCCRNETNVAANISSQEGHLHSACELKQPQQFSLPGDLVGDTNAYLSMLSRHDHLDSVCEEQQQKCCVSMRQCLGPGGASFENDTCKMVQGDMGSGNSICLSTPSQTDIDEQSGETDKLDCLERASLSHMNRSYLGGQNSLNVSAELMEFSAVSDNNDSGHERKISGECASGADSRLRCREKFAPQKRKMRMGRQDEHRSVGGAFNDQIGERLDTDTLSLFRDRLLLQKQAKAVKRKGLETIRGLETVVKTEEKVAHLQLLSKPNQTEEVPRSTLNAPMARSKSLKLLTRDIAQKALLEAGFTIELRPRRSRDYQDAVYVSPEGRTHWSIPSAWKALKKSQAEKHSGCDEQGCSNSADHEKAAMSFMRGEEGRQRLATVDKSFLKQLLSRFGNDEPLQQAVTKLGRSACTDLDTEQDAMRQAELSNADLTDILLGDLGLLRRFSKKFLTESKCNSIFSADLRTARSSGVDLISKAGMKRKWDSAHALDISGRKLLDGESYPKKLLCDAFNQSRDGKIQGTARCLKQIGIYTKSLSSKHKLKKGKKPKVRSGFRLEVRRPSSNGCEESVCHSRRTILSWMLDRGAVLEKERIFFVDSTDNHVLKEGIVTREGILCSCCNRVFTVQTFEAHAGGCVGDWHQALVFTSGKRLLDCQMKAWDAEIHLRKAHNYTGVNADDTNDDTCVQCGDGGELICCDGCPSTFHASCLHIDTVPEGNWYCPKCSCGTCGKRQQSDEREDTTVIFCNQCEHRYHISCLHGGHSIVGNEVFCGPSCEKVFLTLRESIGVANPLGRGFSWTLLRCMEEDKGVQLRDSTLAIDYHSKLAVALLVIKECFAPMVDPRTNIDMITHAMYNRWSDFDRLNYAGFYTAVLEKEGEIISVASIRIHGVRLAEMPLIGTREKFRRQGMCRLLVGAIEKLLSSLEVDSFILPAIPEMFETWTHAFGFQPLDQCLKSKILDISMMVFPGTELLQKSL